MHNIDLILTITGGLTGALIFGYITHRLGLSPIVGYLIAGIVGPYTPGYVADQALAEQLAEIGVILLMFGVGLQFHFEELLAVKRVAVPGAIVQSVTATALGAVLAHWLGWGWSAGIVYGMALSVASTVVLVRVLSDSRDLHTPTGHIAVGWLVVEDLFTVLMLVVMPALFGPQASGSSSHVATELLMAGVKVVLLVAFTFVVGGRVIPWLLTRVAKTRSRELFTLTVLSVALGIAVGSTELFGVSMALGAFLAGMVVGRSEFSSRAAAEALPMRDAFAVLFFVSVGMLFNPAQFLDDPAFIAATLGVVLIGKPLAALAIVLLLRYPLKVSLAVAVALAQIGEFSFILAKLGEDLGVLDVSANNALVAASIISITVNPLLYRAVGPVERWLSNTALGRAINRRVHSQIEEASAHSGILDVEHRAVIVGYGPVGRTVARLLRENQIEPVIIEMNLETTRQLLKSGVTAVYGDATKRDTLVAAGIERAGSLILSSPAMQGRDEAIRLAHDLNPKIRVLASTHFVQEIPALLRRGAQYAVAGETEVALALTEVLLRELGATPEQIDRERDRVHNDLTGLPKNGGNGRAAPPPQDTNGSTGLEVQAFHG